MKSECFSCRFAHFAPPLSISDTHSPGFAHFVESCLMCVESIAGWRCPFEVLCSVVSLVSVDVVYHVHAVSLWEEGFGYKSVDGVPFFLNCYTNVSVSSCSQMENFSFSMRGSSFVNDYVVLASHPSFVAD